MNRSPQPGFTLIELMITVAVLAILASVALPSYQNYIRESRRADAWTLLQNGALAQERWRANNASYTSDLGDLVGVCASSSSCNSSSGNYSLAVSNVSATGYALTATPVVGSSQAKDSPCSSIVLGYAAGVRSYTPSICWKK